MTEQYSVVRYIGMFTNVWVMKPFANPSPIPIDCQHLHGLLSLNIAGSRGQNAEL